MPSGSNTGNKTAAKRPGSDQHPAALSALQRPANVAPLDTLAQLRKLARNKFISNGLVFRLVDLQFSPLRRSYWNTFHCGRQLDQDGLKLSGNHCNNRWCNVCNRIRTAKLINGYMPILEKLPEKYFVTLTIKNMPAGQLADAVEGMHRAIRRIFDRLRKDGHQIRGLRKIEITYNKKTAEYHPHFHFIVSGRQAALNLIVGWLCEYPKAAIAAQDMRPADDKSCKELFKYFSKLITKSESGFEFHPESLDVIFRVMRKRRTFQPMGIKKLPENINQVQEYPALKPAWKKWVFDDAAADWKDTAGQSLTGYKPAEAIRLLRGEGVPDWRQLDDEFSACKRFDQREYWEKRTKFWGDQADQHERRQKKVSDFFDQWLQENKL